MGTDFTFEDIKQTPELEDYNWTVTGSESIDGFDCWVVQGVPKTDELKKNLGYSKTVNYVRKDIDMAVRIDYWDRKGQELKHFTITSLEQIDGIWTATGMMMENIQTRHKTEMVFSEHKYNTGTFRPHIFRAHAQTRLSRRIIYPGLFMNKPGYKI